MLTAIFIGQIFENFLFGLYSGIFAMYLKYMTSKKGTKNTTIITFYALCALYVLTGATMLIDIIAIIFAFTRSRISHFLLEWFLRLSITQGILNALCDFISQSILIYRCWIVWGCNARVVIIPSILAFAFLGTWLAAATLNFIGQGQILATDWSNLLLQTSLAMSMTVNALVMGLILYRIVRVYRADNQTLGISDGSTLRPVILVVIESGMALFSIQLVRLVVMSVPTDALSHDEGMNIIISIHQMLNGITPTILLVRVSMGLSFHDEKSMTETIETLRFAPNNLNSIPETRSIEARSNDIDVRLSNDVEIVRR